MTETDSAIWCPSPGGEGMLRQHPLVAEADVGKYVHILRESGRKASDALLTAEPWFEVRIVGTEPSPHQIYPAYPQSAIGPYELTRESILARLETLKQNIRTMPTAEKLRIAADFVDGGRDDFAAAVLKLAVAEVEGRLPKVPMPEVPPC